MSRRLSDRRSPRLPHTFLQYIILVVAPPMMLVSCGEPRYFRMESDAVRHFEQNRQQFARAALLYEELGIKEFDTRAATVVPQKGAQELLDLANSLQITRIVTVPQMAGPNEQYVQFQLKGHPSAPYGVIFVPEGHQGAWDSATSDVGGPPRVYYRMRFLGGRWFYYEYQ